MSDDPTLLRQYVAENSEAAFTEFVSRHIALVYTAALRRLGGDSHRARDVTQQVFISAAQNARSLTRHASVVGWLYAATRNAALNHMREENRRRQREQVALAEAELTRPDGPEIDWTQLRPVLDSAMDQLSPQDREVLLLRFFAGRRLVEVGAQLHVSENAARMRVDRALEKLQALLARRGVTSTAAALASTLLQPAGAAVPAGLATTVSAAAISAASAGAGSAAFLAWLSLHKTSLATCGTVACAVALNVGPLRANADLHRALADLESREQQLAALRTEQRELHAALGQRDGELGQLNAQAEILQRQLSRLRPPPFTGFSRLSSRGKYLDVTPATPRIAIIELLQPGGLSSPMRAWQTMLGASRGRHRDMELIEATYCFDAEGEARLDAFLAGLPESTRAALRIRESLVAPVFAQWLWQGDEPQRYSPDRDVPATGDPSRAESFFKITYASGETRVDGFPFKRFDDGWRYGPLTAADAEALLALLDPRTGRPKTAQP